jgi:RsiW-degrading membrane proteinase PrsW (M82 family)
MNMILPASFGLLPILFYLAVLVMLDSFKLVRWRMIAVAIPAGAIAAGVSYVLNTLLCAGTGLDFTRYSIYLAPWIEECAKFCFMAFVLIRGRVGFMVDAAIVGFAIGAGFGCVENVYYMAMMSNADLFVWLIRGMGTGIMHGGAVAIAGITAKALSERSSRIKLLHVLPGWLFAVGLHMGFNALHYNPILATIGVLLLMPALTVVSFTVSERWLKSWLDLGFATDVELLAIINSGQLSDTRIGRYLRSLRSTFPAEVVADMLCCLRLHIELSIRAKGVLMMKEAQVEIPVDLSVREKFSELDYLRKNIGKSGMLALSTVLHTSARDLWQLNFLKDEAG